MNMITRALVVTLGLVLVGSNAQATLVADFTADYQTVTPKTGWAYQRSAPGVGAGSIGNEGYTNLVFYSGTEQWYTSDGSQLGNFNILGPGFMHPSTSNQFTLARFTVPSTGQYTLDSLTMTSPDPSLTGIELWANVNTGANLVPLANRIIPAMGSYTGPSSINLGTLTAGDRIYVGVGPNGGNEGDSSNLQFQINLVVPPVPEPSSMLLLGFGLIGLVRATRRRGAVC